MSREPGTYVVTSVVTIRTNLRPRDLKEWLGDAWASYVRASVKAWQDAGEPHSTLYAEIVGTGAESCEVFPRGDIAVFDWQQEQRKEQKENAQ